MRSIPLVALLLASLLTIPTVLAAEAEVAPTERFIGCKDPGDPEPGVVGAVVYAALSIGSSACAFTLVVIQATCVLVTGRTCPLD